MEKLELEECAKRLNLCLKALRDLYDLQNGCPLPKYEKDWKQAMANAENCLKWEQENNSNVQMANLTIAELESILKQEEDVEIEILPNGEIRAKGQTSAQEVGDLKPLTMREHLGGEYGNTTRVKHDAHIRAY